MRIVSLLLVIECWKKYKPSGSDQIPAEVI
jgi:hypothetical protein